MGIRAVKFVHGSPTPLIWSDSRKPGKQRYLFLCILWATTRKLQQTVLGTGATSALVCWWSLGKALHGFLSLFHPSSSANDNSVRCKSISALVCYSDVGLYYLVQKCQLMSAVTALLCRQPNYKNLLERKIKWDLLENKVSQQICSTAAAQIKV